MKLCQLLITQQIWISKPETVELSCKKFIHINISCINQWSTKYHSKPNGYDAINW